MSKIKVDQLSTTDDSVVVNVSDLNKASSVEVNVASSSRTLPSKLSDMISVKDYGILGDGTDEAVKWTSMLESLPSGGKTLYVPAGTYYSSKNISIDYSDLPSLVVDSEALLTPSVNFSSFLNVQYRGRDETKFGAGLVSSGTTANAGGFKVGGGALMDSGDGIALSSDGHANWMRIQTTKNYNPSEVVIYSSSAQGQLVHQSQNILVRESGSSFDTTQWEVGDAIYAFERALVITELTSANQISVTEIGGGDLTAALNTHSKFHYVYTTGNGICNVSSGVCTRVSGDPFFFFGYGNGTYKFWLNGALRTVSSISNKGNTCTLEDTSINLTNASYKMRDDIGAQLTTIRVQKTTGTDEENLNISAKATGEYEIRAGISGNGYYYPIRFYNGDDGAYKPHKVMEIATNGNVGVMNTGGGPRALFSVDNKTNTPLSDSTQKTAMIVRSTFTDGGREIWLGSLGNSGLNGGFLQGSDSSGGNYQLCINPRGANVGINTDNPVFPLDVNGAIGPHLDNLYTIGSSSKRFTQIWATNGTIQTSDERLKDFEELSSAELKCGLSLSKELKKFRWKDRSDDLIHFGILAQKIVSVFAENGLNALEYGLVKYDEEADIFSVSYTELNALCIAALVEKLGD